MNISTRDIARAIRTLREDKYIFLHSSSFLRAKRFSERDSAGKTSKSRRGESRVCARHCESIRCRTESVTEICSVWTLRYPGKSELIIIGGTHKSKLHSCLYCSIKWDSWCPPVAVFRPVRRQQSGAGWNFAEVHLSRCRLSPERGGGVRVARAVYKVISIRIRHPAVLS